MTTHVFIVNEDSFALHLNYLFAGTGAKQMVPMFLTDISQECDNEKLLVSMLADCSRLRVGDNVVFYLQAKGEFDGSFYGIFKVASAPFLDLGGDRQYLSNMGLEKFLPYRVLIKPYKVYPKGVTEWTALDDLEEVKNPSQMIWSLIYRKLRGNRGNTMITLYESERLLHLIALENNHHWINGSGFSFDKNNREIIVNDNLTYEGSQERIDILPRLLSKLNDRKAHEAHLQAFITANLEHNESLVMALGLNTEGIEWIGNEVSCGVGMQRIDIALFEKKDFDEKILYVIELKDEFLKSVTFTQVERYIKWVVQYYRPNMPCAIQPVIISLKPKNRRRLDILKELSDRQADFDSHRPRCCRPIKLLTYSVVNNNIVFE